MIDLAEQLRQAIDGAEVSRYRLAKMTGISEAAISRFMHKQRTITLETAAMLAAALDLKLTPATKGKKAR